MGRYLVGALLMIIALGPLVWGGHRLRRAALPGWNGAGGLLADAALVLSSFMLLSQTLAIVGLYRLDVMVVTAVLLGLGLGWLGGQWAGRWTVRPPTAPPSRLGLAGDLLAVAGAAAVIGVWSARSALSYSVGILGADSVWYHLPGAARLVQDGGTGGIHHFDESNLTAFYPVSAEYLHSGGMLFLGTDLLSPIANFGWVLLALLAGWVLGRPIGIGPATMLGICVVLVMPGFVGHEAGGAMNDVANLALVLGAAALLVNAHPSRLTGHLPVIALAAALTGLALGTKWTMLPVTGMLTVVVLVLAPKGRRLAVGATWLGVSGVLGLHTYIRNWVEVSNPLPPLELRLAGVGFDQVTPDSSGFASVAEYLTDGDAWSEVFRPGLTLWGGPLWWAVLGLTVVGLVLAAVFADGPLQRALALTGVAAGLGYLLGPQLLVLFGQPWFFVSNLRYGVVTLGLGLALLPLATVLRTGRWVWFAPITYAVIVAVTLTDSELWSGVADVRFVDPLASSDTATGAVVAVLVLALGAAAVWWHHHRPGWRPSAAIVGAAVVTLVGLGAAVNTAYDDRYQSMPGYALARDLHDERIAIHGLNVQYPLYGLDLDNEVEPVGHVEDGRFVAADSCVAWRTAVNDGEFTYVFIGSADPDGGRGPTAWTDSDGAEEIFRSDAADEFNPFIDLVTREGAYPLVRRVYRIDGPLDPGGCT